MHYWRKAAASRYPLECLARRAKPAVQDWGPALFPRQLRVLRARVGSAAIHFWLQHRIRLLTDDWGTTTCWTSWAAVAWESSSRPATPTWRGSWQSRPWLRS